MSGLIYEIYEIATNKPIYVGSTKQTLLRRKSEHKYNYTNDRRKHYNYKIYQHIRSIGGWQNIKFREVSRYNNINKYLLEQRESELINKMLLDGHDLKNVNKNISKKVTCQCGSKIKRKGYAKHLTTKKHRLYEFEQVENRE